MGIAEPQQTTRRSFDYRILCIVMQSSSSELWEDIPDGRLDHPVGQCFFISGVGPGVRESHPRVQCVDPVSMPAYLDPYVSHYARGRSAPAMPGWADAHLLPAGDLIGAADDTLRHKSGRHVAHAGYYRNAVRSTEKQVVKAWGLNVVLLVVLWRPPWGGQPLALPVNLRIHHKGGPTPPELVVAMIREVATWLTERRWTWVVDSGYTAWAGYSMPLGLVISRLRKNTVVYDLPPRRRKGQRGRARVRGKRLPSLAQLAAHLPQRAWESVAVRLGGQDQIRDVATLPVIWYPHQISAVEALVATVSEQRN